jgi:hypothetical protein
MDSCYGFIFHPQWTGWFRDRGSDHLVNSFRGLIAVITTTNRVVFTVKEKVGKASKLRAENIKVKGS